jgi:hypothetical protein
VATPSITAGPVARALEQVRSLTAPEARTLLQQSSPEERAEWLRSLQQLSDAVAAATIIATDIFDANGDGQVLHGAATTQAWVRSACRTTGAEAAERVRLARASRTILGRPVERLIRGSLTYEHLRAIDRGTRRLDLDRRQDAVALLTDLAEVAPVADVQVAAQHLAQVVDPDGTLAHAERQFDRRYLTVAPLMDGMTALDGLLDAEAAAIVDAALRPFLTPDGPTDVRSTEQRRADGLVQLMHSACDQHDVPVAGGERPHLNVVVDRSGLARISEGGWPLHPASVTRISCDAQFTALLLDGEGTVVDLGRTRRLFSPRQRRLLAARDGGCRWPGCHRPSSHTDAHHLIAWQDGGATDAVNALLLCRFHHRLVHEGGWALRAVEPDRGAQGPVAVIGPRGQRLTSDPRGP